MESNILQVLKIPNISQKRRYWVIRTNGGTYYQDFILHQYISIAWDYVSLNILKNQNEDSIKRLIEAYSHDNTSIQDEDDEEDDTTPKGENNFYI